MNGPAWPLVKFRTTADTCSGETLENYQEIKATNPQAHHKLLDHPRNLRSTLYYEATPVDLSGMRRMQGDLGKDRPTVLKEGLLVVFEEGDPDLPVYYRVLWDDFKHQAWVTKAELKTTVVPPRKAVGRGRDVARQKEHAS